MKTHDGILCLSLLLLVGLAANAAEALPQDPARDVFASQKSTTLTLFCSTGFFDSSQPVILSQKGNAFALPGTQDFSPIAAVVPEPSSLVLLGLGLLLGLVGLRKLPRRER